MRATWILGYSAVLALAAVPASAQPVVAAKSGTISVADGKVYLDDKLLEVQPGQFPDIKEKSVLRTTEGRAEVLLPPGMFLRMGENSSFRMISNRLIDTRTELLTGSAVLEIDAVSKDAQVTMLTRDGTVTFGKGIYRFDADPARLKVFEGNADVSIGGRELTVSTGRMMGLTSDTASIEKFDVNDTDSLDHWSRRRGEEVAMANVSAAKRAQGNTWSAAVNPCIGMGMGPYGYGYGGYGYGLGSGLGYGPGYYGAGYGAWAYNPWYGMYTYMPCSGMFMSPYGYGMWSPFMIGSFFYNPGMYLGPYGGLLGGGGILGTRGLGLGTGGTLGRGLSYSSLGNVSHGYSGVVAASSAGARSAVAGSSSAGVRGGGGSAGGSAAAGHSGGGSGGMGGGGGHGGGGGGHGR